MKLIVQLEDAGHTWEFELMRLLRLLKVEISEDEIKQKVLQEIYKT